ncbi:MAG TPA: hypothetical protein VH912_01405 [Streptosporangiaceae bacterium]|jgi:hypothetical protein
MSAELVWRLKHVWPKDTRDLTEIDLNELSDDEARKIVNEVEEAKRAFERYVAEEVLPRIPRRPTRLGVVETLRLFTSEFSMNTDYLLMLSGILGGNGGVLELMRVRYTIAEAEELGRYGELETHKVSGA